MVVGSNPTPVIPREGVESLDFALRGRRCLCALVIPREGVESESLRARINVAEERGLVIPREGVERLVKWFQAPPNDEPSDPERGS